jgi:hypothetical protein
MDNGFQAIQQIKEESFKRSYRAALDEELLNGTLSSSSNVNGRCEANGKPHNADEDEASILEEAWYQRLLFALVVWFLWMFPKTKRNPKVRVHKCFPLVPHLYKMPMAYVVLTNVISLSMWWVGMCLSAAHMTWEEFDDLFIGPKLQFMRHQKVQKPPDPKNKWETFLEEYMDQEKELGKKQSVFERMFRVTPSSKRKRYMMLALNAAMILVRSQPTILLSETKQLKNHLRKYKRNGVLLVGRIRNDKI